MAAMPHLGSTIERETRFVKAALKPGQAEERLTLPGELFFPRAVHNNRVKLAKTLAGVTVLE